MAVWTDYCGIFENKGAWLAANNPDNLDLASYTAHGDDYILLNVLSFDAADNADLGKINTYNRNTGFFGMNSVDAVWNINAWVRNDGAKLALEKYNEIKIFFDKHNKLSDPATYLVYREKLGATWKYNLFIDNAGNRDRKYGKGKGGPCKMKKTKHGLIDIILQFNEGWL